MNDNFWDDMNGLALNSSLSELLRQYAWRGADPVLVAFAQNAVHQALIACALERYRLAQGKLPQTLDELIPNYLPRIPHDTIRGRPMIYQRVNDADFVLRSVGPDYLDGRAQKTSDDWIWAYKMPTPEAKKAK